MNYKSNWSYLCRALITILLVIGFMAGCSINGADDPTTVGPIETWNMTISWNDDITLPSGIQTSINEIRIIVFNITGPIDNDWEWDYDEIGSIQLAGEGICHYILTGTFSILLQPGTNSGDVSGEIKYLVETIHYGEMIFLFDVSGAISKC